MIAVYLPATHDLKGKRGPLFAGPRFAHAPEGLTNPDSITTANREIYVVYANNTPADGSGVGINNRSIIVEYSRSGQMVGTFEVVGKADGLKYNPFDHKLWALRNEDAKPGLTLIDPRSGEKTDYTYAEPPLHGGGYDDSASNPTVDTKGQITFLRLSRRASSVIRFSLSRYFWLMLRSSTLLADKR